MAASWGKIGDIIHSLIALQKLAATTEQPAHLFVGEGHQWISSLLDHLPWVSGWQTQPMSFFGPNQPSVALAELPFRADRFVNVSHAYENRDPLRGWPMRGWWDNGLHSMDFCAACAGVAPLVGDERILEVPDLPPSGCEFVLLLPNCGDPAQRGVSPAIWDAITAEYPSEIFVTGNLGPLLPARSTDMRHVELWELIGLMRQARLIISVDTLASANLAESVGTPIVKLFGAAAPSSAIGPGDPSWGGHQHIWESIPEKLGEIKAKVHSLWTWKERQ